jgi:hypothetical protein
MISLVGEPENTPNLHRYTKDLTITDWGCNRNEQKWKKEKEKDRERERKKERNPKAADLVSFFFYLGKDQCNHASAICCK